MTENNTQANRAKNATYKSRAKGCYTYMKAMYLKENGLSKFPRINRAPDYSHFDEWLAEKIRQAAV